jgi:hypothetical protein
VGGGRYRCSIGEGRRRTWSSQIESKQTLANSVDGTAQLTDLGSTAHDEDKPDGLDLVGHLSEVPRRPRWPSSPMGSTTARMTETTFGKVRPTAWVTAMPRHHRYDLCEALPYRTGRRTRGAGRERASASILCLQTPLRRAFSVCRHRFAGRSGCAHAPGCLGGPGGSAVAWGGARSLAGWGWGR